VAALPAIEIRPRTLRNGLLMVLGCGAFTALGIWMIRSGASTVIGWASVLFFGGGGLFAIPRILRRKVTMVVEPDGLRQRWAEGDALAPWSDVERIDVISYERNKWVALRLRSYERYVSSMSPELADFVTRSMPLMRAARMMIAPFARPGEGVLAPPVESNVANPVTESLAMARRMTGYDILLAWSDIDRPAKELAALLEHYRRTAVGEAADVRAMTR
jgi:hypothetical protein